MWLWLLNLLFELRWRDASYCLVEAFADTSSCSDGIVLVILAEFGAVRWSATSELGIGIINESLSTSSLDLSYLVDRRVAVVDLLANRDTTTLDFGDGSNQGNELKLHDGDCCKTWKSEYKKIGVGSKERFARGKRLEEKRSPPCGVKSMSPPYTNASYYRLIQDIDEIFEVSRLKRGIYLRMPPGGRLSLQPQVTNRHSGRFNGKRNYYVAFDTSQKSPKETASCMTQSFSVWVRDVD